MNQISRPSDELINEKLNSYLEDFWVNYHSNPRFARKSAQVNSFKVGNAQPFTASQHASLKQIDWQSPVYPVEVVFTLVSKDGEVEHMMSDFYCYLDAFNEWRCSQWSVLPRRVG